jgi:hypothetical protein
MTYNNMENIIKQIINNCKKNITVSEDECNEKKEKYKITYETNYIISYGETIINEFRKGRDGF